jgi:hypothetical protein
VLYGRRLRHLLTVAVGPDGTRAAFATIVR